MDKTNNINVEIEEEKKSIESFSEVTNSVGEVTLNQFKNALEHNLEVRGYYDSIVDKAVSKRLDKGIESWKANNLENLINEEINKRFPQKTEQEIKFDEQQKALEKAMEDKRQLELKIKYQNLMTVNNLPMEILDFVEGNDIETTISNIERFKNVADKYIIDCTQKEILKRLGNSAYTPPSRHVLGSNGGSMWG